MHTMKTPGRMMKNFRHVLPIIIFTISIVFTAYTASVYAMNIMDSDSSSELVLANLLSQQNAIMTTDWFYSNELRVLQTNLVFSPLFKIFSNWHTVRLIGVLVLQSILLLSYLFFCRQAHISRRAFLYSASILILPYSVQYGRIVLYHTYYLLFIAIGFLIVGLFLSVNNNVSVSEKPKKKILSVFFLLFVSFLSGLNGIRQIMITMVPLFISAVIITAKTEANTGLMEVRSFGARWKWIRSSLLVCCFGGLGYFINNNILLKIFSFRSYEATVTKLISQENFYKLMKDFFSQFGFQPGRIMFSLAGFLACGSIFAALYVALKGIRQLLSSPTEIENSPDYASQTNAFIGIFAPVAIITMFIVFIFINTEPFYFLYFIPVIVWVVPFLAGLIDKEQSSNVIKKLLLFLTCLIFLANGFYNNAYFVDPDHKQVIYEGLGRKDIHTKQELQSAVDFLQANHYNLGYASYWCSNIVTEMTNGEIPMVNVQVDKDNPNITYFNWLSNKQYREESFVQNKKVFLLLPIEESAAFLSTPLADSANQVYQDSFYIIYDFDYSDDPWNALRE